MLLIFSALHELVHWHLVWAGLIAILCAICRHLLGLLVILSTASRVLGHIDHTMLLLLPDLIHQLLLLLAHHTGSSSGIGPSVPTRLVPSGATQTPTLVTLLLGQAIRTEFKHCSALCRA